MTVYLLDANVLIALTTREHVHHERVSRWAEGVGEFAVCPVVEGALVRFVVRMGAPVAEAVQVLRKVRDRRGYQWWPDDASYVDADLTHVRGHRQVTDAYLAALASRHEDARLATLDEALASALSNATLLVPA